MASWLSPELHLPAADMVPAVDIPWLRSQLSPIYASWYKSFVLREYLGKVQDILNDNKGPRYICPTHPKSNEKFSPHHLRSEPYSLKDLFWLSKDKIDLAHSTVQIEKLATQTIMVDKLQSILEKLKLSDNETRQMYEACCSQAWEF